MRDSMTRIIMFVSSTKNQKKTQPKSPIFFLSSIRDFDEHAATTTIVAALNLAPDRTSAQSLGPPSQPRRRAIRGRCDPLVLETWFVT
jgi:hypothetical protein